jgi:glyoxylate reductase
MTAVSDRPRIFVSQPIRREGLELLEAVGEVEMVETDRMLSRDELSAALSRSDYVFAIGDWGIDNELLAENKHLKGISCAYDDPWVWFDLEFVTSLGIPITGLTISTFIDSTADLTMALLLALAWRIPEADRYTRAGRFRQEQSTQFVCTALPGKTLGMVGLGAVGTLVVPRARPFDLKIVYTKRNRLDPETERAMGVTWLDTVDEVASASDFLSIHADYNDTSHMLVGRPQLELMKESAFLINTARGRVIDEKALIELLRERKIAGAGLDVYWGEPPAVPYPAPDPELFRLDNVILAPHMGGQTEAALIDLARNPAENMVALIRGERPPDLLNPEVFAD